jgi:hypothetical protein
MTAMSMTATAASASNTARKPIGALIKYTQKREGCADDKTKHGKP